MKEKRLSRKKPKQKKALRKNKELKEEFPNCPNLKKEIKVLLKKNKAVAIALMRQCYKM